MNYPTHYTANACRIGMIVALCAACASLLLSGTATAEMIIVVDNVTVMAGQSGFLDISFDVTGESASLAAYQIEMILTGPDSGVRFTGLAEPDAPVFPGQTPAHTPKRPALPGNVAAGNDYLPSGEDPIEDGARLLRLLFETDPGSLGIYDVTVDPSLVRTNFSDGSGALIPITQFVAGSITVVPEPSSLALLCGVGALAVMVVRRRA